MVSRRKPPAIDCTLGGREWRIEFVTRSRLPRDLGACYWDKRLILVRYDQPPKEIVDTLIHECQHALSEIHFAAEAWIDQTSTELADVLDRLGVRWPDN
jgi:hypothetical protein